MKTKEKGHDSESANCELVAWGNLSTFAATLKKGTHLAVEGELRYREFAPKMQ